MVVDHRRRGRGHRRRRRRRRRPLDRRGHSQAIAIEITSIVTHLFSLAFFRRAIVVPSTFQPLLVTADL